MEDVFKLSRKQLVLYSVGQFGNERIPKFIKAPFDLVKVAGGFFLCPISTKRSSVRTQLDSGMSNDPVDEAFQLAGAGDEFFLEAQIVITGEHEMGDYKGQPDTWKGMHKFSQI
jgi:hypothetical protein